MKITQNEWRVVEIYLAAMPRNWLGSVAAQATNVSVERKSDREFDISVEGNIGSVGFRAWLVLGCISTRLNWTSPEVAAMTDYPDMVREGDWSGVRDTDDAKLWNIFHHFKLGELKANEQFIIKPAPKTR
jgi:hypothetical protein